MTGLLETLLAVKGLAVGGWFVLLAAAERLRPAAAPPAEVAAAPARRLLKNGGLWLLNLGLALGFVLPVTAAAARVGWVPRPGFWQGVPGLLLDLLLLDLWIYWWHRANHELDFLWRFHAVHHFDRFLDASTAVRFHFGEVAISASVRALVIVAIGMPLASVLLFEALVLGAAIFHHSNLRLPPALEAALARAVVTPSIHWVHHHRVRRDTDANYATVLSLWDRLFGTRSPTRRDPAMAIGIEGVPGDLGFVALLARPLRPVR
jgi:sterol desaturase/sphingolipid hydroxylase (fatty acid hydroxylase superfamily)